MTAIFAPISLPLWSSLSSYSHASYVWSQHRPSSVISLIDNPSGQGYLASRTCITSYAGLQNHFALRKVQPPRSSNASSLYSLSSPDTPSCSSPDTSYSTLFNRTQKRGEEALMEAQQVNPSPLPPPSLVPSLLKPPSIRLVLSSLFSSKFPCKRIAPGDQYVANPSTCALFLPFPSLSPPALCDLHPL